ncbi:TerB family tellurite resistance protein [Candidatus Accumulibacter contiguus]|uniref:TerB family tellurite resistance protein n=1 Tax=Candidatus Accumulibacter contiguus TaxID=2954381 RepID=UPI00207BCBDD|nr:TerB family tellurite resistance protein [Candidatus Accumulibacter contiguus]
MRNYTTDSAEATARLISLALLADGGLDNSELDSLEKHSILDQLGITPDTFDRVMHEFCNDVLQSARSPNIGQIEIDPEVITHLLGDIRSPALQKKGAARDARYRQCRLVHQRCRSGPRISGHEPLGT